ncbi:MAG: universal stress protein, partial [Aquabacterium sp.]
MPIDGSAHSKAALAFISSRSTLIESQPDVELLNVQYPVSVRVARAAGRELVQHYHESEANKIIKPALAALKKAGLRPQVKSVVGSPGVEVGRIAAEDAADLIVMGSHGHTGFKSLLFGSVTQAVLASCNT